MQHRVGIPARIRSHAKPRPRHELANHRIRHHRFGMVRIGLRRKQWNRERMHIRRQVRSRAQRVIPAAGKGSKRSGENQQNKTAHHASAIVAAQDSRAGILKVDRALDTPPGSQGTPAGSHSTLPGSKYRAGDLERSWPETRPRAPHPATGLSRFYPLKSLKSRLNTTRYPASAWKTLGAWSRFPSRPLFPAPLVRSQVDRRQTPGCRCSWPSS